MAALSARPKIIALWTIGTKAWPFKGEAGRKHDFCISSLGCGSCRSRYDIVNRNLSMQSETGRPLIQIFSKDDCSLCDIAKENLEQFKDKCDIEEINISDKENASWFEKYKYDIPVIHLNGKFLMKHQVFSQVLKGALENLTTSGRQ
eukprot:gene9667-10654_t